MAAVPVPPPSRYDKVRAANYFDNLLQNDPNRLFKKYAVHAADNPVGYTVTTADVRDVNIVGDYGTGAVPGNKLISWVHLDKTTRQANYTPGAADIKEGGDVIDLKASITLKAGWIPTYFLPWKPQSLVWMTIPQQGVAAPGANPGQPDPGIFFTAAINGCSIFFQGNPDSPTIYHAGGDPEYAPNPRMKNVGGFQRPVRDPSVAADFWRSLATVHGDATLGAIHGAEVNKTHYVMDSPTADASQKTTSDSRQYYNWLKRHNAANRDKFRIKEVRPWGCVFGWRQANGNWRFFLQENATIRYISVNTTKKWKGLSKTRVDVDVYDVARPMYLRQIWPTGGGSARFKHPVALELL